MTNSISKKTGDRGRPGRLFGLHLLLLVLCFSMVLPFIWMVLTSLKPAVEVENPGWLPSGNILSWKWSNYLEVFRMDGIHFARWYWNSLFVACWVTLLQVFTSALAAFSFSRLRWPGRDQVFTLYLATMMLPGLVLMIPNFQIMIKLGLIDSMPGLILPAAFSAFGTFLLRQFMMSIPSSLDEAATIDGAGRWQLFTEIILPLARPGLIVLAIFTFMANYNSFFWPLVMMKTTEKYTLPVGLLFFDSAQTQSTHLMMAAVTLSVLPPIILFICLQKYLVKGIQAGAVKG